MGGEWLPQEIQRGNGVCAHPLNFGELVTKRGCIKTCKHLHMNHNVFIYVHAVHVHPIVRLRQHIYVKVGMVC